MGTSSILKVLGGKKLNCKLELCIWVFCLSHTSQKQQCGETEGANETPVCVSVRAKRKWLLCGFNRGMHSTTAVEATVDVWEATACGAPSGPSPSQQSDGGFRVGGAQGLGFLLCLPGKWSAWPQIQGFCMAFPILNWYSSILSLCSLSYLYSCSHRFIFNNIWLN